MMTRKHEVVNFNVNLKLEKQEIQILKVSK